MGLVYYLSNKDYHAPLYDGKKYYSSSQLKDMVKDPELFHKNYIRGEKEPMKGSALDIGTYFHTAILEPHKLDEDCAVWKGFRRGKDWEAFEAANANKAIITSGAELDKAMNCINGVKNSPIAMKKINAGYPEVSAFLQVHVYKGKIYHFTDREKGFNACVLTPSGWSSCYLNPKSTTFSLGLKVRADCLGEDGLYILDLKSTSGDVKNTFLIQGKISELGYTLSASLYLDVFSAVVGKQFKDFIWTFASKDTALCKNYAASVRNQMVGRAQWAKAVLDIAKYERRKWKFIDEMEYIEPKEYETTWINDPAIFPEHDVEEVIEEEIETTHTTTPIEEDLL